MDKVVFQTELPLEEKITVIREELAKLEKQLAEKPKPKKYYVCGDGVIGQSEMLSTINFYDKMGLAFYTKQEALDKVEEMKLLKEVKDFIHKANEGKEPYDGKKHYYQVSTYSNKITIEKAMYTKFQYRFITKYNAEEFGNLFYDRLLKFNLI
jgi:hypothetical protein